MFRNGNNHTPRSHRYSNIADNFVSIRHRAKQLKQIESHQRSMKHKEPVLSDAKIPNLPMLYYASDERRGEYAPRSSLESSRRGRWTRSKDRQSGNAAVLPREDDMESRDLDDLAERPEAHS